ncbi:radical SAM family heme chaperone HemW [bacterium]|nr:radical SAM family heme chaperone HemW [bacterium]
MAGLYIHIPFCKTKCAYCDFYSEEKAEHLMLPFIDALTRESDLYRNTFPPGGEKLGSIYFGGGTPSLLPSDCIEILLQHIFLVYPSVSEPEITIEVNPGTVNSETLAHYWKIGINRLSIGVQSFNDSELSLLGRIHTAEQAEQTIRTAHRTGFNNMGIDLIYGLPNQSPRTWRKTLERTVSLSPKHISAYELTWNQSTPLGKQITSNLIPTPDKARVVNMYLWTSAFLNHHGYEHYEISNFARPGYRCLHNDGYWTDKPYLGLGPSAHSSIGDKRFWNVSDIHDYINVLSQNRLPIAGEETINYDQTLLERMMLGLRRKEGIPLAWINRKTGEVDRLIQAGLMSRETDRISLTTRGFLLADEVALHMAALPE